MAEYLGNPGCCAFGLPLPDHGAHFEPPPPKSVLVFSDGHGFCKEILAHAPLGMVHESQVVTTPAESLTQADVAELLKPGWDIVIFATGIDPPPSCDIDEVMRRQDVVTRLYFWLLQEIVRDKEVCRHGIAVITCDVFAEEAEIHEELGLAITTSSTLFGMTNTARLELENVPIQYIDTEWSLTEEHMPALASEVFRVGSFGRNAVRILKSGRYVLRQNLPKPYAEKARREFRMPGAKGTIAISGGNGALGLVMSDWLLDKAAAIGARGFNIKLLSRSMKIAAESQQTWEAVQRKAARLGIVVEHAKCDVSKRRSVDKFVKQSSPNLFGFIHSAGVLRDGLLFSQSWDTFEDVFNPKHRAAYYVHNALEKYNNPTLSFLWLFSSVSVWGNLGQVNYSGSNSVLDALARHRRSLNRPATAIQWGAWAEVGMAAGLDEKVKARWAKSALPPHTNKEGLLGLEMGIRTGMPTFSVCRYNSEPMVSLVSEAADSGTAGAYMSSFTSCIMPLPLADANTKDVYNWVRSSTVGTSAFPQSSGLVYRAFVDDDGDDE
eukprot:TRINITY_DN13459_c0_g1_i1.p1 TRINITY_DN13459_c0_g1~~TRINITY_DN13459_c0_g1_i1.p1  ORF type:complete len:614 (+),score=100.15 TRINITY_DN13459_c0_g1_i1:195-1844(+)